MKRHTIEQREADFRGAFVSLADAARILGVSYGALRARALRCSIPSVRMGRSVWIAREDLAVEVRQRLTASGKEAA